MLYTSCAAYANGTEGTGTEQANSSSLRSRNDLLITAVKGFALRDQTEAK